MTDRIARIVAELPQLTSVTGIEEEAEQRLRNGDAAFPADLGLALAGRIDPTGRVWQYRSVFDRMLRLLATTPGAGTVHQALRLLAAEPSAGRRAERLTASLLAGSRRPAELAAVFSGPAPDELRACLVHELLLRGVDTAAVPGLAAWATGPHVAHHPLGALPLTPSPLEALADLPGHSTGGSSRPLPYGQSWGRKLTARHDGELPAATECTAPETAAELGRAVANWAEESNGRIEARVFEFAAPLPAGAVAAALLALGLDSLAGAGPRALTVTTCGPAEAWSLLFAAAATGGAYNHGAHGAYGRLAARQSLGALAGADAGAGLEPRADACHWFAFDAATPWFDHVAWDLGLAALSPDGRRLAVLAATDTD
ncbi:DUF6183 family protein [Kitasatospora sp. NPDC059646]|uniref:DUF6183 family protein n=1 Tax=Kitasatospora sp. NPDC059646 TaxID=3346893 RepID=UPI0036C7C797